MSLLKTISELANNIFRFTLKLVQHFRKEKTLALVDEMAHTLGTSFEALQRSPHRILSAQNSIAKALYLFGYEIDEISIITGWPMEKVISLLMYKKLDSTPKLLQVFTGKIKERPWREIKSLEELQVFTKYSQYPKYDVSMSTESGNSFKTEQDFCRIVDPETKAVRYEEKISRQAS